MTVEQALNKFGIARIAVEEHINQNKPVFDAHERLVSAVIDAENALADEVEAAKVSANNGMFAVTYSPQTMTFADIEVIDKLIAEGKLDKNLRAEIVKTVDRPAKIKTTDVRNRK